MKRNGNRNLSKSGNTMMIYKEN